MIKTSTRPTRRRVLFNRIEAVLPRGGDHPPRSKYMPHIGANERGRYAASKEGVGE